MFTLNKMPCGNSQTPNTAVLLPKRVMHALFLVFAAFAVARAINAQTPSKENPKTVSLLTQDGLDRLESCETQNDYVRLTCHFECQSNPSYCGPASIAMIANALAIPRPQATQHRSFRLFSQTNIFSPRFSPPITAGNVRRAGMTLREVSLHLQGLGCNVSATYASDMNKEEFCKMAIETLRQEDAYLVINYDRSLLGQKGAGHFSPIGAYSQGTDEFLVLDVARYKYPPVWVKADLLFEAIATFDGDLTRGCVIANARMPTVPVKE